MEITSQLLAIKESKQGVSVFMIITCGKYLELEPQLGFLKSLGTRIMAHLGLPHEALITCPHSSSMTSRESSLRVHSRSADVMGTLSYVMEVPMEEVMLPCQPKEDKQGTREDMDLQVGSIVVTLP